jgi:transcriptional regulator with XRE-family HTH domain
VGRWKGRACDLERLLRRNVGARIRELRKRKSLKVTDIQRHLESRSKSYVYSVEMGERLPSLPSLAAICEVLGVDLSTFFGHFRGGVWRRAAKQG